jgi:TCP-1/cpn60 chaperonin family
MDSTSRLSTKKSAKILPEILNDASTLSSISTLRKVFESCLGPYGHCKLVHNNKGGHVTVTSSASRLLQSAQISAPVLRLISSAVEEHCKNYADCGKLTATLMLLLIEKALAEQFRVCELLELLAHECAEFVSSDCSFQVRKVVSFDTVDDLVCLVRGWFYFH